MKVRYIYNSGIPYQAREIVCSKLTLAAANVISLPGEIEICFTKLASNEYGNTVFDHRFKNRVNINCTLNVVEIPRVLIHELIHVHQMHTGKLKITKHYLFWNGKQHNHAPSSLTYADYLQLPWEQDVINTLDQVMQLTLKEALILG